jgi:hypothetical protein
MFLQKQRSILPRIHTHTRGNLVKINSRPLKMQNLQLMSKQSDLLWDFAIFFKHTSKILPSLQHLYSNSPPKTLVKRLTHK